MNARPLRLARRPFFRVPRRFLVPLVLGLAACQNLSSPGSGSGSDGADPAVVERQRTQARPAPPWMVGRFSGRHLTAPIQDISLEVDAAGRLTGQVSGILATGQYIGNDRVLWSHGSEVVVQRQPNGFRLVQTRNPNNATEYTRLP